MINQSNRCQSFFKIVSKLWSPGAKIIKFPRFSWRESFANIASENLHYRENYVYSLWECEKINIRKHIVFSFHLSKRYRLQMSQKLLFWAKSFSAINFFISGCTAIIWVSLCLSRLASSNHKRISRHRLGGNRPCCFSWISPEPLLVQSTRNSLYFRGQQFDVFSYKQMKSSRKCFRYNQFGDVMLLDF